MADESWRRWSTEEREGQVSPSSAVGGDYQPFIDRYRRESDEAVTDSPSARLDLAVPSSDATVDVFPAAHGTGGPMVAFVHGGYWQELSRAHSRFPAPDLNASGWTYAAIGYPLAPSARIAGMISACAEAFRWLRATWSPELLVAAGSSAGAHLAVCAAAEPGVSVEGVVAFSGVYDLAPLRGTSVDEALSLDEAEADSLSPLRRVPSNARAMLAIGENETPWFGQLQTTYANYLRTYGVEVSEQVVIGRNHFDVVFELGDPRSAVRGWLNDLRGTPRAPKDR